ncbi:MAG: ABC transporter substrate-binding protein [Alphaproteobacteria bacterium]|nr:ABC transporter substrate-binding protein [Alphaproteobacteria bacterium]
MPVDVAFGDYDRTRPIVDGRVKAEGMALTPHTHWIGHFCRKPVYEEYDAAEMSFSWYVMARDRGEPVIAVPIFLLRMAVLAYVYVRSDSPVTKPSDLIGKKIGARGYRQTVNLWLRGLFKEHYGLSPEQVTWITSGPEDKDAGYVIPESVPVEIREGCDALENLKNGAVDAVFCTKVPKQYLNGEPWIRRLFPNTQEETQRLARDTGIVPITHTLIMNKNLADREPWVAENLFHLFDKAQRTADEVVQDDPKRISLVDSVFLVEQQRKSYGSNPYVHGIEPNRKVIETFVRYAHEQGYISREIPVEELFAPSTLGL